MAQRKKTEERLGVTKLNNQGCLMKVIEYNSAKDMTVEFQDEWKRTKKTRWQDFKKGEIRNPHDDERVGTTKYNNQGCLMKCVKYDNSSHIIVEFQDDYKAKVSDKWCNFMLGTTRNPYSPSVFNVGMIGEKYPSRKNNKNTNEYIVWYNMLQRCFDKEHKEKYPTYQDTCVCKEWLLYENFYEWFVSQENYLTLKNTNSIQLDKDILIKGNKIYSPERCCLVPQNVNKLFVKSDAIRGDFPIGVVYHKKNNNYIARSSDNNGKYVHIGVYFTPEDAFYFGYKPYKENIIHNVAKEEYSKGNITKQCYEAMMKYEVEITD